MTPQEYASKATEQIKACNLCGSDEKSWASLAIWDRFHFPVHQVLCMKCGLTFITPRMPASEYAEFYSSGEYRRLVSRYVTKEIPLRDSQSNYAKSVSSIVEHKLSQCRGATMLDVGGSTGVVADQFRDDFGIVPTVLDLAKSELEIAQNERGIESIYGSIDTFDPGNRKWDIVGIFQSIDHFLDPKAALTKVREWLNPDGLLIIDICELRHMIRLRKSVEAACKLDHPFGFTSPVMASMLEIVGFESLLSVTSTAIGKSVFLCRKSSAQRNTLPSQDTVIDLLAIAHKARLDREIANQRTRQISA